MKLQRVSIRKCQAMMVNYSAAVWESLEVWEEKLWLRAGRVDVWVVSVGWARLDDASCVESMTIGERGDMLVVEYGGWRMGSRIWVESMGVMLRSDYLYIYQPTCAHPNSELP